MTGADIISSVDFKVSTAEEKIVPFQETLSYEEVAAKLSYDPATGVFMWLVDVGRSVKAGTQAGSVKATRVMADGRSVSYRYIRLEGRTMLAGRLAWLLHFGKWPIGKVVPIDGNPLNLAIDNLSEGNALPDRYDHDDPEDRKKYHRDLRLAHPAMSRENSLLRKFGISFQDYMNRAVEQRNLCAICEKPETAVRNGEIKALAVDHCHTTGAIRALLCQTCNQMIGFSKDDPAKLRAGAAYLEKHQAAAANVVPLKTEERA